MPVTLGVVMDPIGSIKAYKDSTLAMLLGRLEILSFIVLFTPGFWRR